MRPADRYWQHRYWQQYLGSLPLEARPSASYLEAFHFAYTVARANEIAALVLSGVKTATNSVVWINELEGRALPWPGDLSIVTDGDHVPLCVIETTEVSVRPFNEVDATFAFDTGEGDRSLEEWREGYWAYLMAECRRHGREPSLRTPMVCERFRVVYQAPLQDQGD